MGTLTTFWLRQHLTQGRIAAVYILTIVMVIVNAFVYSGKYIEDLERQREHIAEYDSVYEMSKISPEKLSETIWSNAMFRLSLPNSEMDYISDGNLEKVPVARRVGVYVSNLPSNANVSSLGSTSYTKIDLDFLITIVFTFFAIILTYDAVCGERQSGTLKQIMANGVPRSQVVISKVLAAMITLSVPLLLGLVGNLTAVNLLGIIPLTFEHLQIVTITFVLALLLLLFFVSLGIAVSSMTRSPITSLLVLIFIWVVFVQIIPGSAKLVGEALVPVRTVEQFRNELILIRQDILNMPGGVTRQPEIAKADNFRHERSTNRRYQMEWDRTQNLVDDHLRDMSNQAEKVRALSRLSPKMVFSLAVARMTNNDLAGVKSFYEQVDRYRNALFSALREADSRDPESSHLIYTGGRGYLSNKPFQSELPRFNYSPPGLVERVGEAALDVLILFSLGMGMLLISVFAFNRYDVR